jgi:hypothetical protein
MALRIGADALIPPVFRTCAALDYPHRMLRESATEHAISGEHESRFLIRLAHEWRPEDHR